MMWKHARLLIAIFDWYYEVSLVEGDHANITCWQQNSSWIFEKKNHIEIQQQPKNENLALVIFGATLILFNFRNEILFFVDACLRRLDQTNPVIMNGKKKISATN